VAQKDQDAGPKTTTTDLHKFVYVIWHWTQRLDPRPRHWNQDIDASTHFHSLRQCLCQPVNELSLHLAK